MSEFNLDELKKSWQEQQIEPRYDTSEILSFLGKKSRNYVKYIFIISVIEFSVFLALSLFYFIKSESASSFINILKTLGVEDTSEVQHKFQYIYLFIKIASLVLTAVFVVKFYNNYVKIKVEDNLKLLILHIVKFRKTVNLFIMTNIGLLILSTLVFTVFTFEIFNEQHISLTHPTLLGFLIGILLSLLFSIGLIWLYYKIVYGIIMGRLGRNLAELQKIEQENPES